MEESYSERKQKSPNLPLKAKKSQQLRNLALESEALIPIIEMQHD